MDLSRDNIQQLYGHLQILSMCRDISYLGMEVQYMYDTHCRFYAYSEFILLAGTLIKLLTASTHCKVCTCT